MTQRVLTLTAPWRLVGHATLVLATLTVLAPLVLVLGASFKPPNEIHGGLPWPIRPTLENYAAIFEKLPFARYLWNSFSTTALRVAGQLVIAVLAAYAFARFVFPGRNALFAAVLFALMIPHQLVFLPIYLLIGQLGWFDTYAGLIVPNLAMPIAVFFLRQHLLSFPRELYDAAEIDGAGELRILWSVVLPNLKPALAAISIILFVDCWNEYFWPLVVTETDAAMTAQIGIRRFLDAERGDDLGPLMAGVVLVSLPALAVFALFQRRILQTFMSTGMKG